jgi:hypothetical protein
MMKSNNVEIPVTNVTCPAYLQGFEKGLNKKNNPEAKKKQDTKTKYGKHDQFIIFSD